MGVFCQKASLGVRLNVIG